MLGNISTKLGNASEEEEGEAVWDKVRFNVSNLLDMYTVYFKDEAVIPVQKNQNSGKAGANVVVKL